jgi:hypothetical protein
MATAGPDFGDVPVWFALGFSIAAFALSVHQYFRQRSREESELARAVVFFGHDRLFVRPRVTVDDDGVDRSSGTPPEWRASVTIDNQSGFPVRDLVVHATGETFDEAFFDLYTVNSPMRIEESFPVRASAGGNEEPPHVRLEIYFTDANGARWRRKSNAFPVRVDIDTPVRPVPDIM